ncbi:uncharacterized protein LY79DRAFT_566124 [Colletotrichum navitas]|uniref:Secreted protein n=1 Tax=Colletotrichum navitas TaxID=681940 RepID=A0AAD8V050_9PEZI|nr:uncharacterized protein LY79DRAFT_566124 [Colletotrichum navitas]KAK1574392.1 hypothetical protein LY79DRAFT_566124 [Colletotrichum navitas]
MTYFVILAHATAIGRSVCFGCGGLPTVKCCYLPVGGMLAKQLCMRLDMQQPRRNVSSLVSHLAHGSWGLTAFCRPHGSNTPFHAISRDMLSSRRILLQTLWLYCM